MKSKLSKGVRFLREGVKKLGTYSASMTCGVKSYPFFGVPRGLTEGTGKGEGVKHLLYARTPLRIQAPKTVEPDYIQGIKGILAGFDLAEEGVLVLNGGTATNRGGNLNVKGQLVTTFLQPIDGKLPHENDLFRFSTKNFFPRIYRADYPVVTLAAGWQGAFYHWVFEVLPRLHLVERAGYSAHPIYVESTFPFQKESLELMGITPDKMLNAKHYAAVRAPQLIIPSIPLIPTEWSCGYLREKILPTLTKKPPLRLYVSRNDASRRRILNEGEIFALLQKHGFQKVQLSRLSFKEQAELFYSAEVVVAPHGAGLSHLVFCAPKTPVLEIFSPAYFHPCYWHVCDRIGLSYHYFLGEGESPEKIQGHQDPDIFVDSSKLAASLKLMEL